MIPGPLVYFFRWAVQFDTEGTPVHFFLRERGLIYGVSSSGLAQFLREGGGYILGRVDAKKKSPGFRFPGVEEVQLTCTVEPTR